MSSSRVHTTLTGAPPISLDSSAASMAKSHLDLRPKPPPSSVVCNVISSGLTPKALATSSRVPPGLCTGAHTSHLPPVMRAVAAGASGLSELRRGRRGRQLHDLLHARHLQGRAGVEGRDLAAHYRRPRNHRELHAGQHDVLSVHCLASGDVDDIGDAHVAFADV